MKRRFRKIVNFFAFNLLFFALYLNFIHKDNTAVAAVNNTENNQVNTAAFSGTVLIDQPGQYLKKTETTVPATEKTSAAENKEAAGQPLKLSIN
jgi:hypothetical protein